MAERKQVLDKEPVLSGPGMLLAAASLASARNLITQFTVEVLTTLGPVRFKVTGIRESNEKEKAAAGVSGNLYHLYGVDADNGSFIVVQFYDFDTRNTGLVIEDAGTADTRSTTAMPAIKPLTPP